MPTDVRVIEATIVKTLPLTAIGIFKRACANNSSVPVNSLSCTNNLKLRIYPILKISLD